MEAKLKSVADALEKTADALRACESREMQDGPGRAIRQILQNQKVMLQLLEVENARLLAALADDDLATTAAKGCHDLYHNQIYCSTCSARADGIETYREALRAEFSAKKPAEK